MLCRTNDSSCPFLVAARTTAANRANQSDWLSLAFKTLQSNKCRSFYFYLRLAVIDKQAISFAAYAEVLRDRPAAVIGNEPILQTDRKPPAAGNDDVRVSRPLQGDSPRLQASVQWVRSQKYGAGVALPFEEVVLPIAIDALLNKNRRAIFLIGHYRLHLIAAADQ